VNGDRGLTSAPCLPHRVSNLRVHLVPRGIVIVYQATSLLAACADHEFRISS
jgi:hypothetical protein